MSLATCANGARGGARSRRPVARRVESRRQGGAAMRIEKVISGGQTGADRAALDAAIAAGIPHGGWCPRGRLAEDGRISSRHQLRETLSNGYPGLTRLNVECADADADPVLQSSPSSWRSRAADHRRGGCVMPWVERARSDTTRLAGEPRRRHADPARHVRLFEAPSGGSPEPPVQRRTSRTTPTPRIRAGRLTACRRAPARGTSSAGRSNSSCARSRRTGWSSSGRAPAPSAGSAAPMPVGLVSSPPVPGDHRDRIRGDPVPGIEPHELSESCALDVADRGPLGLDAVGEKLGGMHMERASARSRRWRSTRLA